MAAEIIHVHAGLHKTGSTSIQHMLAAETPDLAAAGFSVWSIAANHSIPIRVAFDTTLDESGSRVVRFGDRHAIIRHLSDEIGRSRRSFVISAEAISGLDAISLEALASAMRKAAPGAAIPVIVYVRRLDRHAASYVQQVLKRGQLVADAIKDSAVLSFRSRIGNLMKVFGRDRVSVRLAPEVDEAGPTALLEDFLAAIGAPAIPVAAIGAANQSLSMEAALLMDRVNSLVQLEGGRPLAYGRLVKTLRATMPGPAFRLPGQILREIVAARRDDIDWLAEETGIVLSLPDHLPEPPAVEPSSTNVARFVLSLIKEDVERRVLLRRERGQRPERTRGEPGATAR